MCETVNPGRAGGAYGYVDMGGWIGGQARYVMVPYADFNLLKFPDKNQALSKIMDLTMLTDILPTGFHGALTAGVKPGSTVYVAGAGPVGLAAAASAQLLGAAVIMIGDMNEARLGVGQQLARRRRIGDEMDVDAVAVLANRNLDIAQRLGRQPHPGFLDRGGIPHRLDHVDHLAGPFLAAGVEHRLLVVGRGGGERDHLRDGSIRSRGEQRQLGGVGGAEAAWRRLNPQLEQRGRGSRRRLSDNRGDRLKAGKRSERSHLRRSRSSGGLNLHLRR